MDQPRHSCPFKRCLESIYFHHPDARVKVWSNTLNLDIFTEFSEGGYSIVVQRYDLQQLVKGTLAEKWVEKIDLWKGHPHFYSHLTDLLRIVILYKYGGLYTDTDVIFVKSMEPLGAVVGFQRDSLEEQEALNGAVMKFPPHSEFLEACLTEFVISYRPGDFMQFKQSYFNPHFLG